MKPGAFLILLLLCGALQAQVPDNAPWCPPGASWVYQKSGLTYTLYQRFDYTSDTVIQGFVCKKLSITNINYYGPAGSSPFVSFGGREIYRQSGDSIFWWNNTSFQFIYRFSPQVGDRWVESNPRMSCSHPAFPLQDTLTVRSIRADTLNGRIYKRIEVKSDSDYFVIGPVLSGIGSLVSPFPMMNDYRCFLKSNPGFTGAYDGSQTVLYCYSDNTRGTVIAASNCSALYGFTTRIKQVNAVEAGIKAGPNPARTVLHVNVPANTPFIIRDLAGQVMQKGRVQNGVVIITHLANGLYVLHMMKQKMPVQLKFVKQ